MKPNRYYGICFKHVDTINVMNDNFLTTVKIPLPHREQLSNSASRPCSEHSSQNDRANSHVTNIYSFGTLIMYYMNTQRAECRHYLTQSQRSSQALLTFSVTAEASHHLLDFFSVVNRNGHVGRCQDFTKP